MGLQNWRWWQWAIVSLVVGGLIGFVLTRLDADDPTMDTVPWQQLRFGIDRRTDKGEPVFTKIHVGPVVQNAYGRGVRSVTYWERMRNKTTGQWEPVRQFRVITDVPLSPASPRKDYSVLDFLAEKKKATPTLDYRYDWWWEPRNLWFISVAGSVLVIGVLWPVALRGMVAVGLAEPPEERGIDLSRVSAAGDSAKVPTGRPTSAAERAKLDAMNDDLEAALAKSAVEHGRTTQTDTPSAQPAILPLKIDTSEPVIAVKAEDKPHEYTGEFYPVAKPGHKD